LRPFPSERERFGQATASEPFGDNAFILPTLQGLILLKPMTIESYLLQTTPAAAKATAHDEAAGDGSLEQLVQQKSRILSRKLDILGAEIAWRLHIAARNLHSLREDKERLGEMLRRLDHAALYHLREHQEKGPLYRTLFALETETRAQHTECWRDVAMVMRDFLYAWEAHEQARSRAIFIDHVGTGTPRSVQKA